MTTNTIKTFLNDGCFVSDINFQKPGPIIKEQDDFDRLFELMYSSSLLTVIRTAEAIENITRDEPQFLKEHKEALLGFLEISKSKELKRLLVKLISRLKLNAIEFEQIQKILKSWAENKSENYFLRVDAMQALFTLVGTHQDLREREELTASSLRKSTASSAHFRVRNMNEVITSTKTG